MAENCDLRHLGIDRGAVLEGGVNGRECHRRNGRHIKAARLWRGLDRSAPVPRDTIAMSASAHPIEYEMVEPLPTRLRRFREQCGISRSELAVRTGLSRPTIWAWESGKTQPRLSNLRVLASVLGISQLELVGGLEAAVPDDELDVMMSTDWQHGEIPAGLANPQRLSIMIYAAKLSIAALAGIKAQNVKISIEL